MMIVDVYGKIEKTIISNKLKIYISNVPSDWKESIIEDMEQEIRQQKIDMADNLRRYGETFRKEYTLDYLKRVVETNITDFVNYKLSCVKDCLRCLADHMICIFFDYDDHDMPFFDWTTNCFEGRFCEEDYAEKVVFFCNFINRDLNEKLHMNCIYSSNTDPMKQSRILANLCFHLESKKDNWRSTTEYINDLKEMGALLDGYLKMENDYYKLDYIMNSIFKDSNYNQNHFFKSFSLLELILLKPKEKTEVIDSRLAQLLREQYGNNANDVSRLLRQMRNKIGHGDFMGFNKKAEEFAEKFMNEYNFDYSEYSRLNWVLLHTCCLLDDLLKMSLLSQLSN